MPLFDLPPGATPDPAPGTLADLPPGAQPDALGDTLKPMAPYGYTDMLLHGTTFGGSDALRAAARAGTDWAFGGRPEAAPGTPPSGFDYQQRAEEIAGGRRHFEAQHPFGATAANLAGSLAYAPGIAARALGSLSPTLARVFGGVGETAEAAPSMVKQIAKSIGVGTAGGAATGAADNPEAPLSGAIQYAAGGALGGALAPVAVRAGSAGVRAASNLWDPAGNAQRNAIDKLRSITGQDTSVGHPDLSVLDQRLIDSEAPLSLADMSPGVRRYVGSLYDRNTPAATMIGNELERRDAGAQSRLLGGLDRTVGGGPETFEADALLRTNQLAKAKPLYGDAYMQAPINPDLVAPGGEVRALIDTPAGKGAMKEAMQIAAQERVSPQSLGITLNAADEPVFTAVPSWKTLDYVKRGFDGVLEKYPRNALTGKLELDTFGRATAVTLGEYRDLLVRENPKYGEALKSFSGDAASRDALAMGAHSLVPGLPAAEARYMFDRLSPADQDFYRLGAANALRLKIRSTPDLGDETKRIANSTEMRDKLRPMFGSDSDYEKFVNGIVRDERKIFETNRAITGGSQTAMRVGGMGREEPGFLASAAPVATGALIGGGGLATAAAAGAGAGMSAPVKRWIQRAGERLSGQTPEMQNVAASMALTGGQPARQVLGLLQAPQNRLLAPWLPLATGSATAGTTLPSLLENGLLGIPSQPYDRR